MTFDFSKVRLAGQAVAAFLAPLALWLIVLWFLAALVLLLGSAAA